MQKTRRTGRINTSSNAMHQHDAEGTGLDERNLEELAARTLPQSADSTRKEVVGDAPDEADPQKRGGRRTRHRQNRETYVEDVEDVDVQCGRDVRDTEGVEDMDTVGT